MKKQFKTKQLVYKTNTRPGHKSYTYSYTVLALLHKYSMLGQYVTVTKHSGKMKGIPSVNTACIMNSNCINRVLNGHKKCICKKCFAIGVFQRYSNAMLTAVLNYFILNDFILNVFETDDIAINLNKACKHDAIRFESFGDLQSVIQCLNYWYIALHVKSYNKNIYIAQWTKEPMIIKKTIEAYGNQKPENLHYIGSSSLLNVEAKNMLKFNFIEKIFTVYELDKNDPFINCGGRDCSGCMKCYSKNDTIFLHEALK